MRCFKVDDEILVIKKVVRFVVAGKGGRDIMGIREVKTV
jgi:hypothetical protein